MTRSMAARLAPFLALLLWTLPAAAQQDAATAQALFEEARSLMQQQRYDQACPKFAESQRLGPAAGTLLNLGECYSKQGKTASAWAAFKEAIPQARAAGQKEREDFAKERVAEIEPSLVKLAIKVEASDVARLVVKRDGVELGQPAWGTPVPVDPGPHVVEASQPGKKPWKMTVDMMSGERSKEVIVPSLEELPAPEAPKTLLTQRNIGIGVAGVGGVALVIGAIVGLGAISTNDDAKTHCRDGNLCDQEGLDLLDSASGQATTSTIFFLLGAAAGAVGAVLYFTAPEDNPKAKPAARLTLTPAGLRGTW